LTDRFALCKLSCMNKHPISVYRAAKGLSQAAFAQLVGCKRWMINRIEVGARFPSRDLLLRIADVTGIPADDLIRWRPVERGRQ